MAKLKNVTMEDLNVLLESHNAGDLLDISNRVEKMYCDRIENPMRVAGSFLAIARAASELAGMILMTGQMQEQQRSVQEQKATIEALKAAKKD